METGDKVYFINDLGRRVDGTLIEWVTVVSEADADSELRPKDFKDVEYRSWDVRGTDGKLYCAKEKDIQVILSN